jgi:hypothetical protein
MSNRSPPIRSSRRVPRAPARLVAEDGADVARIFMGQPSPVVAAEADAAPGGSPPPRCPPGLTMAKIQAMAVGERFTLIAGLEVQSFEVRAPVAPDTVFVVEAVIHGYRVGFKLTSECLVKAAQCACLDNQLRHELCKHILRALVEAAELTPPPPPSPAMNDGGPLQMVSRARRITPSWFWKLRWRW